MTNFRIADTFTDSLARLTGDERKAAKTTAFDLQMNLANPGMSFHKLDKAKDRRFWSVRAGSDLRLIVHRSANSLLLCYVGHHDDAYAWAERRKIETHPTTGAAQIVEIRERVQEIRVPKYVEVATPVVRTPLFAGVADGDLLAWGVPTEWLPDVLAVDNDDDLLKLASHLPAEASEALLELATGGTPALPVVTAPSERATPVSAVPSAVEAKSQSPARSAFEHPDAQRRFRTVHDAEELRLALEFPWDKWTIFLHPSQREWVDKDFSGPARVSGSAGTGKTVVALHRAVALARRHSDARVALLTFSEALAAALRVKLRRLIGESPQLGERVEVASMDALGARLYAARVGKLHLATSDEVHAVVSEALKTHPDSGFSLPFAVAEWRDVVDAWQLGSWEQYRDVQRLGRRTRLPETRRKVLWAIFATVRHELDARGWVTPAGMFGRLVDALRDARNPPFDFVVVDEAQDISVAQLKFLSVMGGKRPNALFFAGDLGQRIFQQPFSWKSLGVDIRGRARTLRVNYRTSHQIRQRADRLLGPEITDVDGNVEDRRGTVSVFNGPEPDVRTFVDRDGESAAVAAWLRARMDEGMRPEELGVFVRSAAQLERADAAVARAGLAVRRLDAAHTGVPGKVSVAPMHLAKGLEFRAVAVMACDDEVIPSRERLESVADEAELEDIYNTERYLLYVACTRARDNLAVTGVEPASEFLRDFKASAEKPGQR